MRVSLWAARTGGKEGGKKMQRRVLFPFCVRVHFLQLCFTSTNDCCGHLLELGKFSVWRYFLKQQQRLEGGGGETRAEQISPSSLGDFAVMLFSQDDEVLSLSTFVPRCYSCMREICPSPLPSLPCRPASVFTLTEEGEEGGGRGGGRVEAPLLFLSFFFHSFLSSPLTPSASSSFSSSSSALPARRRCGRTLF